MSYADDEILVGVRDSIAWAKERLAMSADRIDPGVGASNRA